MQLKGFTQITQVKWLLPIYQSQKCDAKWKSVMGWLFNLILANYKGLTCKVKRTHGKACVRLMRIPDQLYLYIIGRPDNCMIQWIYQNSRYIFDLATMGAAAKVVRGELLSSISSLLDAGLNRAAAPINVFHLSTSSLIPWPTGS